jgi:hypothetical protein
VDIFGGKENKMSRKTRSDKGKARKIYAGKPTKRVAGTRKGRKATGGVRG